MKKPPNENLQPTNRQAMNHKLVDVLVFGLADHPAGIRLTKMTKERYAGLSAVSGAGRDVLFYGEFTGTAARYVGAACGCAAIGSTGDAAPLYGGLAYARTVDSRSNPPLIVGMTRN